MKQPNTARRSYCSLQKLHSFEEDDPLGFAYLHETPNIEPCAFNSLFVMPGTDHLSVEYCLNECMLPSCFLSTGTDEGNVATAQLRR